MFSDVYGSVTTTFIRNEVVYLSGKHDFVYLTQKVMDDPGKVRTHCIPFEENAVTKKLKWYLWKLDLLCSFKNGTYARQLNDFIRAEKPDVIHCHFAYEAMKLLQNIDRDMKIPIFVHFHGYDASQMLRKACYVRALKACLSQINVTPLLVSSKIESNLAKHRLPVQRAEILRCGVDLKLFNGVSAPKEDDKIVFLQISSLVDKKGHEFSLHAFSIFLHENPVLRSKVKVFLAGNQPEYRIGILKSLAKKLGIEDNVSFVGNVTASQAVYLLSKANVFIHHSITAQNGEEEGIPTSIMEAMAMKLPVLSTFHAGIPELVKDGINGLLCDEKDVETYAKLIGQIMGWSKLDVNRDVIEQHYNIEQHNRQLEALYLSKIELDKK